MFNSYYCYTYRCLAFSVAGPSLELSPGLHPGLSDQYKPFETCIKNVFVRSILVHPLEHIRGSLTIVRYINSLTYLFA